MKQGMLALAIAACLVLSGCGGADNAGQGARQQVESAPMQKYEAHYYDVFDTYISFSGYAGSQAEFDSYDQVVYAELLRLHQLYDIYNDYDGTANLKTVNDNAGISPVPVDASIIDLLQISMQAYDTTHGTVNVAMGPVLRLWHDSREAAQSGVGVVQLPERFALEEAMRYTDITKVVVDAQAGTVYLPEPQMALDVGAVAKGYAAQKAIDKAVEAGFSSGILNAGGNVVVVGSPQDGRADWSVGVQAPELTEAGAQELFDILYLQGPAAVVTSGDYQRYFLADGKAYHHIIDPETLLPADNARAVTVLYDDSTLADILSTAVFILPYEQGVELLEEMGAEAVWIWHDGSVSETAGYRERSKNNGAQGR